MQPRVTPVRAHLTSDQVVDLIQNAAAPQISAGLEIVDLGLNVLEDISGDLAGGQISRNSYADLHASATLHITRDLDWGADLVRPYYVMSDGVNTARFNLGVFHINTPTKPLGAVPVTYEVTGYDMLLRLHQPVGDAYAIAAGTNYLATVESILLERGYQQYIIDQARAGTVSPSSRAWAFDARVTWLKIVNDLLAAVGYAGVWADWDGRLRCEPYILPADREPEWIYTDNQATTMLGTEGELQHDFFDAPNRWVFYRSNLADGDPPVEGNGMYTYQNNSIGETSIEARRGLVISGDPIGLDVADQAALIASAHITIQADMDIPTIISRQTFPNPLHWHFDRLFLADAAAVPAADVQCTAWTLPLPPSLERMQQSWTVVGL